MFVTGLKNNGYGCYPFLYKYFKGLELDFSFNYNQRL